MKTIREFIAVMGGSDHPTILVVHEEREFRDVLSRNFRRKGFLVLEAQDAVEALKIVVRHSRRIHLLLADDGDSDRVMAETLKPYRPDMRVIHMSPGVNLSSVLIEVSKVLEAPFANLPRTSPRVATSERRSRQTQTLREADI